MEFAFYLKKFISFFCQPLNASIIIGVLLAFLILKRLGASLKLFYIVVMPLLFILFVSSNFVGNFLVYQHEKDVKAYEHQDGDDYKFIAPLGHGYTQRENMSPIQELSDSGLKRILEAMRLQRNYFPAAKILLTGYGYKEDRSYAQVAKEALLELGVAEDDLIIVDDGKSKDTLEEIQALKDYCKSDSLMIVSSASHLPRAQKICKNYEVEAKFSACDFMHDSDERFFSSGGLKKTERSFHEWFGRVWLDIKFLF